VCAFLASMSLAVLADNLGVLWVAIEATTITTAFLVGYRSGRRSLEAAWKYVVLGSVGVAIAFLGIVILYAATRAAGHPTLSLVELVALAGASIRR
jgi:hydrogenase-4 component F